MAIKPQVASLLNKKMDRADFLKHVAIGVVAISGVAGVLRAISGGEQKQDTASSYGGSTYGGTKQS